MRSCIIRMMYRRSRLLVVACMVANRDSTDLLLYMVLSEGEFVSFDESNGL